MSDEVQTTARLFLLRDMIIQAIDEHRANDAFILMKERSQCLHQWIADHPDPPKDDLIRLRDETELLQDRLSRAAEELRCAIRRSTESSRARKAYATGYALGNCINHLPNHRGE